MNVPIKFQPSAGAMDEVRSITVLCRLPWRRFEHTVVAHTDTTVEKVLNDIGFDEPSGHYFIVCNGRACLGKDSISPGSAVIIFPVMTGG